MKTERRILATMSILISMGCIFQITSVKSIAPKRDLAQKRLRRKLEEEQSEENIDHETVMFSKNSFDDSESVPNDDEEPEVGNIYEAKMIEFEDEIDGQFYLGAIEWEDRYWLDFHNLMQTVKGESRLPSE